MYSSKKRDPSCNRYSIKHKNQHGPATFQLKTQRKPGRQPSLSPCSPAKCKPAPTAPAGSAGP